MSKESNQNMKNHASEPYMEGELEKYREWIKEYRAGRIGEIKMQKIRLQLGTYHQRQQGVQMQRIKLPGGLMSSDQLTALSNIADKYGSGFIHFSTREDAQIYYIKLEDCPDMMKDLGAAGITTREACGNTVRNITACYRSGVSATEAFDTVPYAQALFSYLVRNKYNQVMGRKFKIAFESCSEDHAGMLYHDFGFQAVIKDGKRGFRTFVGGGLGAVPILGHLYTEFLPVEDLLKFAAATVRIFDRHGERKNRMAARMKFLVKKMGWEKFKEVVEEELKEINLLGSENDYLKNIESNSFVPKLPSNLPENPAGLEETEAYKEWLSDNVIAHKIESYRGVHIRLKLGDLVTDAARKLSDIAKLFSNSELKISIEQNLFLPWVPEKSLPALYQALSDISLADAAAETLSDTTTCPGADTCRLGITSAKGLGAAVSAVMSNGLSKYKDLAKDIKVKVSGCPNGCAQHGISQIGFQGAAVSKDGKTVPSHELFLGGGTDFENTKVGERIGKFPTRNGPKIVGTLLELYNAQKKENESFSDCMNRIGKEKVKETLASYAEIPTFDQDPEFYKDWGHENEKFAVRTGIKGECAGAPVQEKVPVMTEAEEKISQAEAFYHTKSIKARTLKLMKLWRCRLE